MGYYGLFASYSTSRNLANKFLGYIVTVLLQAMPKLIWEKKLQEAVKRQQRFGWSVREMKGAVFVQ